MCRYYGCESNLMVSVCITLCRWTATARLSMPLNDRGISDYPNAKSLFNRCIKDLNVNNAVWYTCQPLAKRTYSGFMTDLCKQAKCSKIYTAHWHCLRATAIQAMNDAGHELRHIMFMTGHKNEASIRSYNRHCSVQQQKSLSATLSRVATGEVVASSAMTPVQQDIAPQNCMSQNHPFGSEIGFQRNETQSNMSNILTNAGILNNSMFSSSVFTINLPTEAQKWRLSSWSGLKTIRPYENPALNKCGPSCFGLSWYGLG